MRKKILIPTILLLTGGSIFAYKAFFAPPSTDTSWSDTTATVSAETYNESIKVSGTAKLAHEQKLRFLQGGKVAKVSVKAGDTVKKGDLLATVDMTELNESLTQARDRLNSASTRLENARAKIGGLEGEKQRAELTALESKKRTAEEDLQKLIQSAEQKSAVKRIELDGKRAELQNKEAAYKVDLALYEQELANRPTLIAKKTTETKKTLESILQNAQSEYSDDTSIRNGINKIFAFTTDGTTSDDRTRAESVGWNVGGYVNETRSSWQNLTQPFQDLRSYLDSLSGKTPDRETALKVNDMFVALEKELLITIEKAQKTLDLTQPRDVYLSMSDIDSMRSTISGYRNTLNTRINTRKENATNIKLITDDALIAAQVDKELAEKKQTLTNTKIGIEKLRSEIMEATPLYATASGQIEASIQRDIDGKKQEVLELEVQITSKKIDINKIASGKTDEIINLELEVKSAQSELNKTIARKAQYELRAPINGTIRSVKMMEGDNLSTSSTTSNDGTITIEDNNAVLIITKLGQKDVVRVKQGTEAQIMLDTFPDLVFTGTVVEISSSPDEGGNAGESLYETRILFDRGEHPVYSGMSASIIINLTSRDNVLFVPLSAIKTDATTGEKSVIILHGSQEESRIITTGITDADRTEVLSGLTGGETVKLMNFDPTQFRDPNQMGGAMGM